ncbi:acyl-CoA-binding domain-containing protein 5A-like isoform X7 [Melanotaenia boesemani]|uniref:acyl-CoA-binding domain-containing protein 5A-like isoform X7 n=1 Tax=Melanotaenia boesemani TaxID=1250792 RepID=UPI001C03B596|nr:acyl-CoA-binding domain-containing protein 5A-like isoform X7 [Melanotaenia boesemani]
MSSLSGLGMAQEEHEHSLEEKFAAAVKVIRSLPEEGPFQPSDDLMLMFYSYYKQATVGPCNVPRPMGFWDNRGKIEWDAWSSLGNMTKEEAMTNYIEDIQLILETIPISDDVSELVQKLGNFYTEVDGEEEEGNEVDKRPFTRPFVGQEDSSPDPRFLMVDDRRWRSDTKGSNSSVEPSMSSFTNGTHSSLNSEVEEEELACSLESSVQYNPYMLFNGHFSDHSDAAPDSIHRSADSDNEEFCDSMEHLAMERLSTSKSLLSPGSGAASVRPNDLWFESSTTLKEAEDEGLTGDFCHQDVVSPNKLNSSLSRRGRGSPSPQSTCSSPRCVDAAGGGFTQSRHPVKGNVSEQIAAALLRLQGDMADVLHRLHTLEELSKSQSRSSSPRQEGLLPVARKFLRPSWWPFDSSPLTLALTALWPLITHLLFQLYLQRKRRKTM